MINYSVFGVLICKQREGKISVLFQKGPVKTIWNKPNIDWERIVLWFTKLSYYYYYSEVRSSKKYPSPAYGGYFSFTPPPPGEFP